MCIPTRTHLTYNNDKPWFTAKLRHLYVCTSGNVLYKQAKIHTGKGDQRGKEELFWKTKDSVHIQGLCISEERSKRDRQLQDTIPQHCGKSTTGRRSEWVLLQVWKTPHTRSEYLSTQPLTPPATPQKRKKAPGPDGVTPACLKSCADPHLHTDLQQNIIPIPKKSKITGLNDYRPVALTSVVMKSFEILVLAHLKDITGPLLDPLQFT